MDATQAISMRTVALVFLGGGLGSVLRFAVSEAGRRLVTNPMLPWGTLAVNVTGSLLIGWLAGRALGAGLQESSRALLIVGLLGGYTTFSAFSLELVTMIQSGSTVRAVAYASASVGLSVLAAAIGLTVGRGGAP